MEGIHLMFEISTENWNGLVNSVTDLADKTQRQLVDVNSYLSELNRTLMYTNVILTIIALTFITSLIIKVTKYKRDK
ncbi:hypothetical protein [Amphibacillus cookii]|uniref:hypothetical protein n=1 Tax=Amphibacillus cookii TaxID=767787 RepID=UPI0019562DEA|nr:hypothetical protein [Amphibacillus cookii]MBM7541194.1 hypothetical protein [Amphibacillus cookii]